MYLACLKIPATLEESDLERLGPALDGLNTGYYASREVENNDSSPWLMRWIVEEQPSLPDFSLRLNIWSSSQNIALSVNDNDWSVEEIDESRDWLAESYRGFQPFEIADFYIYGSHYEGDIPADKIPLLIDAAIAFGSGEHPTTAGCLEVLCQMKGGDKNPKNIMDMGCGSGILAVASAKLFPEADILAIDIEEDAIEVTKRHQELNHISTDRIKSAAGDGFQAPLVSEEHPFDLIIANILAGPLKEMALDLIACLDTEGEVILSGLLNEQADSVLESYQDLELLSQKKIGEWSTLHLKKMS